MPAITEQPCGQCGQPHKYSQRDGWYSTNNGHPRHPYTPKKAGEEMRVTIGHAVPGFTPWLGVLTVCAGCHCLVDDRRDGQLAHLEVCPGRVGGDAA